MSGRDRKAEEYSSGVVSPAICPGCPDTVWRLHSRITFKAGWDACAKESESSVAGLVEALEKVQGILEENGTPTNAEEMEVLCAALSSYRAKRGE